MQLPFFVVHGAVVWKVLLAAIVAGSFGLAALWRRRNERRRARAELLAKLDHVTPLKPGAVILRGRIASGSASSQHTHHALTADRTGELVLDHAGVRVAIEGEVTIDQGSATAVRRWKRLRIESVSPGDEVIALGVARRRISDEAGYREPGDGWELGDDVHIFAVKPSPRPRPRSIAGTLVFAAVSGLLGYGALYMIGSRALAHAQKYDRDEPVRSSLGNLDAVALAAAMPGSREKALNQLSWDLERVFEHTEEVFQLRLELGELRGECRASKLFGEVRLEEALVAARACGESQLASHALIFLGRFEEAWNEPGRDARPFATGLLAIATGRWAEAAAAADERASEFLARERSQFYSEERAVEAAQNARCLAALFRSWGGDKAAFAGLAGRDTTLRCKLTAALALPEREQAAALAEEMRSSDYDTENIREEQLRAIDPKTPWRETYRHSLADVLGFSMDKSLWLAPAQLALGRTDLEPRQAAELLARAAGVRAFRGDLAGARRQLDQANRLGRDHLDYSNQLALALLDGAPLPPPPPPPGDAYVHPGIEPMVALRRGELPGDLRYLTLGFLSTACETRFVSAIRTAQTGDGAELAAVLRECRPYWNTVHRALLAVLPLVKTHREEVAAGVRGFRNFIATASLGSVPFRFLESTAWHRDLARSIGDTESAAAWQALFDRHAALLDDRKTLLAFWMWSD